MDDHDLRLKDLLGPSRRAVDGLFVERVRQSVLVEQRLRAARVNAWKKFAVEVAASGVVVAMLALLISFARNGDAGGLGPAMSPSTFALFIFAIWAAATLRPTSHAGG